MFRLTKKTLAGAAAALMSAAALGYWGASETRAQAPAPAVPLTGTWTVDPVHSNINFSIRHLGLSVIRGRFDEFTGTIVADAANPEKSSVQVSIKAASIDTDVPMRDQHLRTPDFFEVEKYPEITFKSTKVEKAKNGFLARGMLTMHGASREVALPFRVEGPIKHPFAGVRFGVETTARVNRQDYGLKYHEVLDNGALALANDVDITISLQATPAK
jgi:polyisoprenoid-binding protein YceI